MKLKYYLRGLGTGIVVTALILGISNGVSGDKAMTDEEVLARAKQLGWSESTVLSEMAKSPESEEQADTQKEEQADTQKKEQTDTQKDEQADTQADRTEDIQNNTQEVEDSGDITDNSDATDTLTVIDEPDVADDPEANESVAGNMVADEAGKNSDEFGMPDEAGTVTITIVRGDSSDSVSRRLEEAGLVDSATAYDKYLCQNGYDKSIRIGTFEIPADATGEEIAKMITGH